MISIGAVARKALMTAVLGLASACITIPTYDAKTDDLLTGLQSDTDSLIGRLQGAYDITNAPNKACAYSSNKQAADQLTVSLSVLGTRIDALAHNASSHAAFGHLSETYKSFFTAWGDAETRRADHCVLPALLATDQQALDSAVGGLLKLELAKKGSL